MPEQISIIVGGSGEDIEVAISIPIHCCYQAGIIRSGRDDVWSRNHHQRLQ